MDYPFGVFTAKDYRSDPHPEELITNYRVSASTAFAVSHHELADEGLASVRANKFLLIVGASGDGKTTLATGIGGFLAEAGLPVFTYQRPVTANSLPLRDVLTFLEAADRECALILDDANVFLTESDLSQIGLAAGKPVLVLATWTRDSLSETVRLDRHHSGSLLVSWDRLQSGIRQFLLAHEQAIVRSMEKYQDSWSHNRVGMGYMNIPLVAHITRYEKGAKTAAEFFFLLRGGGEVVTTEMESLAKESRSDVPVLYAAVEQIAGFEQLVTPIGDSRGL